MGQRTAEEILVITGQNSEQESTHQTSVTITIIIYLEEGSLAVKNNEGPFHENI